MSHIFKPLIFVLGLLSPASVAAAQKVEITPFVGYQFGGWFTDHYDDRGTFDEVQDSETFGLILDFSINRRAQIEVLYESQETELEAGLFHDRSPRVDLDLEYFHVGFLWQWLPSDEVRPFVVGSLGVANLELAGGRDQTQFSTSVGGGVKLFFNDRVGARFEGRLYNALIDDDDAFCHSDACFGFYDTSLLFQFELKAGLILAF